MLTLYHHNEDVFLEQDRYSRWGGFIIIISIRDIYRFNTLYYIVRHMEV